MYLCFLYIWCTSVFTYVYTCLWRPKADVWYLS